MELLVLLNIYLSVALYLKFSSISGCFLKFSVQFSDSQISGNFSGDGIGESVGQMLVHLSIEENRQASKTVARIAAQLLESSAARIFYQVNDC